MKEDIIQCLHDGRHSLVVANGTIRTFDGRGISDLYRLLDEEPELLRGASVADKVVGKAAAALMMMGQVKELYADVISTPALALLRTSDLAVSFGKEVPHIINRSHTGWCPMESRCYALESLAEIKAAIRAFMEELKKQS